MEEDFREILKDTIEYLLIPDNIVIKKISGIETKGSEFYEFIVKYSKMFQSDEIPQAQSIYEATLDSQMKIIVDKCFDYYKVQIYQNNDIIQAAKHIYVLHEKCKAMALLKYNEARKMGKKHYEEKYKLILIDKIENIYNEWRLNAEKYVEKFEAEKEKAKKAIEEKEQLYNEQLEATKLASEKLLDLEKKKNEIERKLFESEKTMFEERLENKARRLKEMTEERENERKARIELESKISELESKSSPCVIL
ncbi:hypothetical protein PVAND_008435 [Polypedilum vanderplanki]|nr:hypothetical protein PVAND_008435 [Polypedilum vanderplanki]